MEKFPNTAQEQKYAPHMKLITVALRIVLTNSRTKHRYAEGQHESISFVTHICVWWRAWGAFTHRLSSRCFSLNVIAQCFGYIVATQRNENFCNRKRSKLSCASFGALFYSTHSFVPIFLGLYKRVTTKNQFNNKKDWQPKNVSF